ncbi:RAxF-45 family protein [Camelliibacillus cellulosilyticus]|uniref:RAxF-45 family protein n=1 Tax=Camelliibacillus cellulosilyticus TaxID=2174486 RepID=A0ABV9GN25_9BACL
MSLSVFLSQLQSFLYLCRAMISGFAINGTRMPFFRKTGYVNG